MSSQQENHSGFTPAQQEAINPMQSAFVQANAGTGKTTVLTGRLLRILFLSDNLDNTGILCLTYTKAGAGEMRNRILHEMHKFAMADDTYLTQLIADIVFPRTVTSDDISHARQMFYTYIDNPDILSIKTIHSFCEEVLHRFPIEAGLSPAWSMITDLTQAVLKHDAFLKMIHNAKSNASDTIVTDAFDVILDTISEDAHSLNRLLRILSEQYKYFFDQTDYIKYRKYFIDTTRNFLQIQNPISLETDTKSLQNILDQAQHIKNPPQYISDIITKTKQYIDKTIDFEEYKFAYLTKKEQTKIVNVSKKDFLIAEQNRVYKINEWHKRQTIFQNTLALFDLSAAFATTYKQLKSEHNLLDFEDLILYTRQLFSNQETMGWVLSQMNTSINHILVDEAQDTSPDQWDIIVSLVNTMISATDYTTIPPSTFVVGDTKQSIFGFQGADPHAFSNSRKIFERQLEECRLTFKEPVLDTNYRSVAPILETVDEFFDSINNFSNNNHKCCKNNQLKAGFVELHKLVDASKDETTLSNYIDSIADKIAELINSNCATPSDIMILVKDRNPMAPIMVNKLKARNIPVAGSDRIKLPDFPVIRDLMHLIRFCIDNSNDYSLCCVLKSPMFRLNEADIFKICNIKNTENAHRKKESNTPILATVFEILQYTYPDIHKHLCNVCKWSAELSPYTFFTRVLSHDNTRTKFIAALGSQIIEPLEEFMTICLSYERTEPGTMRDFIKWFITGASEIKRDTNHSDGVRVITVHGSKGLQSKIVFLIDTAKVPQSDPVIQISETALQKHHLCHSPTMPPIWLWTSGISLNEKTMSDNPSQCLQDVLQEAYNHRTAEYYRLLYVAMTRAREQLYIYGFKSGNNNISADAWISKLWNILSRDTSRFINQEQTILRITNVK